MHKRTLEKRWHKHMKKTKKYFLVQQKNTNNRKLETLNNIKEGTRDVITEEERIMERWAEFLKIYYIEEKQKKTKQENRNKSG